MEGIGKLIELLNEWERERVNHNTKEYIKRGKNSFTRLGIIEVISKSYGFIKWLVDNDKIDIEKLLNIQNEYFRLQVGNDNYNSENYFVDGLLMLLAISDTPIDDLISYLK